MSEFALKPADRVEITVLVDNYADSLVTQQTPVDRRLSYNPGRHLLAEHGFSCLVRVFYGGKEHSVLLDAGLSAQCLPWNLKQLDLSLAGIGAVVLSHGHYDHTGALPEVFHGAVHQVPLIAHPDAFLQRKRIIPGQAPVYPPVPDAVALKKAGADIRMRSGPSLLAAGCMLTTGGVERTTLFEKPMPDSEIERDGEWIPDTIPDDQALVINVKNKGLVVLTGCAHAGIINTVQYAAKLTGIPRVHAVLGGFHLNGKAFAPAIRPTIDAMQDIGPEYLVPMHCTGRDAISLFMEAMPGRCILNTVGTTYVF